MRIKFLFLSILAWIGAGTLLTCELFADSGQVAKPLKVVTTTGMIADLVRNVGQNLVSVSALMGPGVDPHLYKATQGDLIKLTDADHIFYNGLHLEGKMSELLAKFSSRKRCVAVSKDIPIARLRHPPEFSGHPDPHIWFDVALWSLSIDVVLNELISVLPADKQRLNEQAEEYRKKLNILDQWVRAQIASIPHEGRVLVTAHDAFGYFGNAYGIEVRGLQGISTASEFGLYDLKRTIDLVIERKVKAIFVESSVPRKFVLSIQEGVIARGGQVVIGGELFSDAMGAEGSAEGNYIGMVTHNVNTIVAALK